MSAWPLLVLLFAGGGAVVDSLTLTGRVVTVAPADLQALTDLFWATGGPSWKNKTGWSSLEYDGGTSDPCGALPWYGISCQQRQNESFVAKINLNRNGLTGSLPETLAPGFSQLAGFNVAYGALSGTLSEVFCSLTSLNVINFEQNSVQGTIPECIGSMASLRTANFDGNKLSGSIQQSLCKMTQLEQLFLVQRPICETRHCRSFFD